MQSRFGLLALQRSCRRQSVGLGYVKQAPNSVLSLSDNSADLKPLFVRPGIEGQLWIGTIYKRDREAPSSEGSNDLPILIGEIGRSGLSPFGRKPL